MVILYIVPVQSIKKENEKQIEKFITKYPDMKKRKEVTILPYQYHSDGFYMCPIRKGMKI